MNNMFFVAGLVVLGISQLLSTTMGTSCNGKPTYCELRFDEFTFPATHNSYSGAQDAPFLLYGRRLVPGASCAARNQGHSITQQLDNGIRALEIDTCLKEVYKSLWELKKVVTTYACRKVLFADPVSRILKEVDAWMKRNPQEVVVISFTKYVDKWTEREIARDVQKQLEKLWGPTAERVQRRELTMNTAYKSNGMWPTLGDAVRSNQRVFMFIHPRLASHMGQVAWTHNTQLVAHTKSAMNFSASNNCRNLVTEISEACAATDRGRLVSVDMFLAKGWPVCTSKRADACNVLLPVAAQGCYRKRKEQQRTVNILKIDFPERRGEAGYKALKDVAADFNKRNVDMFVNPKVVVL